METSKKLQSGWTLKVKMDQIGPILKKFTETNLFLIKLDYLYSVWVL